jgi:hypothetical protein
MFESAAAYVAALFGMLFAGASALSLIYVVDHLDAEVDSVQEEEKREPAAV